MERIIVNILEQHAPYPLTTTDIISQLKLMGKEVNPPDIRKAINKIRREGLAPVLANSKGYYLSYERKEVIDEIDSLTRRARKILSAARGLKTFLKLNQLQLFETKEEVC